MQVLKDLGLFENVRPVSGDNSEQQDLLSRLSKYNRVPDTFPVNIGDGESIAVSVTEGGQVIAICRHLDEQVELEGGKTLNRYTVWGVIPLESAEAGRKVISDLRAKVEANAIEDLFA